MKRTDPYFSETYQFQRACAALPDVGGNVTEVWQIGGQDTARYGIGHLYGVTLGTITWPIYSTDGLTLCRKIGETYRITTKEWTLQPLEVIIDFNNYAAVISEMMQESDAISDMYVLGFFLPKSGLYLVDDRHNDIARNGKQIDRTVEVSSSSSRTGKKWTVLVYKDGTKSCNCPSWIFHNTEHGGNCKHTLKVK